MRNATAIKALLALGTLSGAAWAGTSATFTDTQASTATFTSGTVALATDGDSSGTYAWTSLDYSNMKPTDVKYAPLVVANSGSLDFTYTMTSSSTNADSKALRSVLTLGAKLIASGATCDATSYGASATTVIANAALSSAAISTRTLTSGSSEKLCVRVELPTGTGDAYQGAATTTTFTFAATQV